MDKLKGYKTDVFNVFMGAMLLLRQFGMIGPEDVTEEQIRHGVDAFFAGGVALWTIGGIYFRSITDSPVWWKKKR